MTVKIIKILQATLLVGTLAFACTVIAHSSTFSADPVCRPLIVAFDGFKGKKRVDFGREIEAMNIRKCGIPPEIRVFQHDELSKGKRFIRSRHSSGRVSHTTIVGYSYGGDTAYNAARALGGEKIDTLLITLDPVSKRAWPREGVCRRHTKVISKPNRSKWINVYAMDARNNSKNCAMEFQQVRIGFCYSTSFGGCTCDETAWAGGIWGKQTNADMNVPIVRGYEPNRRHCNIVEMNKTITKYIEKYIECQC